MIDSKKARKRSVIIIFAIGLLLSFPVKAHHISILTEGEALNTLALVNQSFRLAEDFYPPDLVLAHLTSLNGMDHFLRKEAAEAAEFMFDVARDEGLYLYAVSGFRSYQHQLYMHNYWINTIGAYNASKVSAKAGHSEHQLGLALDLSTESLAGTLRNEFAWTMEGQWLMENAHRFGFIIRYPEGAEAKTGFYFEPWHIRYVGKEAAKIIYEQQLTLEEFLG